MTAGARVTVLGTGIMGAPMAARLADAGMAVTTWNRTVARAAVPGTIPAPEAIAAVRNADVVVCMLSSGPVCDAVLLGEAGVIAAMQSGAVLVVMSSIPVETARAQAEAARACDVDYVDAPVSGGEVGAKAGTLSIMAGGDAAVVERLMPVFTALGRPTHVGPVGCGQLAKLANQLIVATTICAVAEALTLAAAGGADPRKVREALLGGFADSTILNLHGLRMVERRFAPGGPARYQLKDTSTALGLARDLGLTLPVAAQVDQLFGAMVEYGDGDLDHSAVILELARLNQRVEERA
jgi:2-hydroxy-3-oxopropionate reductase